MGVVSTLFSLITIYFIFILGCVTINSLAGSVGSYHEVCPLCFQEQEVDAHLFMHCPLVLQVWFVSPWGPDHRVCWM